MSRYARQLASAARSHDAMCDCCGSRHSDGPASKTPSVAQRIRLRALKGRPNGGTITYRRADNGKMETAKAYMADPILLLATYRRLHRYQAGASLSMEYGRLQSDAFTPTLGGLVYAERQLGARP